MRRTRQLQRAMLVLAPTCCRELSSQLIFPVLICEFRLRTLRLLDDAHCVGVSVGFGLHLLEDSKLFFCCVLGGGPVGR